MVAIRKPFFVVPLDLGAIASSSQADGHPASNLNRLDGVGLTWVAPDGSAAWIRGQLPQQGIIDFCAIVSANSQVATTYRLRLGNSQAAVDGNSAAYDSGTLPFISPAITRADGLYHSHLELPAAIGATWWRIDIAGHAGAFEAAGIVLGKRVEPSRYYDKDFERGMEDLGSVELNRFAVPDVTPGAKLRTLSFTLSWLNEAEYEGTFAPLAETVGTTRVIYCCFDSAPSAYRQNRTYLGWLRNAPFARGGAKPRNMAMEFQIRSLI